MFIPSNPSPPMSAFGVSRLLKTWQFLEIYMETQNSCHLHLCFKAPITSYFVVKYIAEGLTSASVWKNSKGMNRKDQITTKKLNSVIYLIHVSMNKWVTTSQSLNVKHNTNHCHHLLLINYCYHRIKHPVDTERVLYVYWPLSQQTQISD